MKLLTAGKRPASVWHNGAVDRVDVHDAWYVRHARKILANMARVHPDRGRLRPQSRDERGRFALEGRAVNVRYPYERTGFTFARFAAELFHFKKTAGKWYEERGLKPPRIPLGRLGD